MKIFTWMHRKLHSNVDYCVISHEKDSFSNGGKKSSALLTCEKDTEALLHDRDHVTLIDKLGGWQDGILAIGTFGLDQLKPLESLDEYSVQGEEYSVEDGEEDGELNPLAVKALEHELERTFGLNNQEEKQMMKSQPLMNVEPDNPLRRFLEIPEFGNDDMEMETKKKKGERTTLADLFNADTAVRVGEISTALDEISAVTKKKSVNPAKHVRSLAKKLIPWKVEDSRPTTKLHRMIRRVLKRKIYPELEIKIYGGSSDSSKIDATVGDPGMEYNSSVETGSLLQDVELEL